MKIIALSNGGEAIVDDDDFERLGSFKWFRHVLGYAYRQVREGGAIIDSIYLHRQIMGNPIIGVVDHINGNKLDNRKANLRSVKNFQNIHNSSLRKNNTSGCKGLRFDAERNIWIAQIYVDRKRYQLGRFSDKLDAVRARALAEIWFAKRLGKV